MNENKKKAKNEYKKREIKRKKNSGSRPAASRALGWPSVAAT